MESRDTNLKAVYSNINLRWDTMHNHLVFYNPKIFNNITKLFYHHWKNIANYKFTAKNVFTPVLLLSGVIQQYMSNDNNGFVYFQ